METLVDAMALLPSAHVAGRLCGQGQSRVLGRSELGPGEAQHHRGSGLDPAHPASQGREAERLFRKFSMTMATQN